MPELPDITVYLDALEARVLGHTLAAVRVSNPFVLRTAQPPLAVAHGRRVAAVRRIGKRIVYAENEANYCARCQTGGKLLADRALSRLLKGSWPRNLDEIE
jgi:formamidopyrimidine-DNA glycosylase